MKNKIKIMAILLILVLPTLIMSCSKSNENNKEKQSMQQVSAGTVTTDNNNNKLNELEELKKILEKKGAEGEGINEEFTTDGKLHEDKFLNKIYSYPDTADSFKIEKDEKGYFITDYIDESPILEKEVPVKEEKSRLKLYSGIYLIAEDGDIVYAYDTKLEKLVFLNKYMKVMNIALE